MSVYKVSDRFGRKRPLDSVMMKQYEVHIPAAQAMKPIGEHRWFARARVKQIGAERVNDFVRILGEWHGKTSEEAEAKARRAAEEWIARHEAR